MPAVAEQGQEMPGTQVPSFNPAEYSSFTASGKVDEDQVWWKVMVRPAGHMIIRDVCYDGKPWDHDAEGWEPEGVIWPTWPARSEDEAALAASPLAEVQQDWSTVSNRLRDSAKWMATVLGAALATVVGASPLVRQSMIIEEVTLQALARARATAHDRAASEILCEAQTARAARLLELRTAAARIATVGEYYRLRARSTRATYGGVLTGLIGTAAVVAAFAWPLH